MGNFLSCTSNVWLLCVHVQWYYFLCGGGESDMVLTLYERNCAQYWLEKTVQCYAWYFAEHKTCLSHQMPLLFVLKVVENMMDLVLKNWWLNKGYLSAIPAYKKSQLCKACLNRMMSLSWSLAPRVSDPSWKKKDHTCFRSHHILDRRALPFCTILLAAKKSLALGWEWNHQTLSQVYSFFNIVN